jgi:hypothetical protein
MTAQRLSATVSLRSPPDRPRLARKGAAVCPVAPRRRRVQQASLACPYKFLHVIVINWNLDDDRLLRGVYLDNDAPRGIERRRIEKEKFINSKMRA